MKNKYPECEKMVAIKDKSQAIGEFLEWLQNIKEMTICQLIDGEDEMEYSPTYLNTEKLLAEFFNIDLDKVEEEKRQMLKELRKDK
jgi:hypothetical protein